MKQTLTRKEKRKASRKAAKAATDAWKRKLPAEQLERRIALLKTTVSGKAPAETEASKKPKKKKKKKGNEAAAAIKKRNKQLADQDDAEVSL